MSELPKISEAEWIVMRIIWNKKKCTANEIIESLENDQDWKPKTIKTLISRLCQKNAIAFEESGRNYIYFPLVNENECIKTENRSFLKRVYGGALKTMFVNFIEDNDLSNEEIEELKRILNERK